MRWSYAGLASGVALALTMGATGSLPAAQTPGMQPEAVGPAGGIKDWLAGRRVEDVVGTEVFNQAGERIGEVEDVVRDLDGAPHAVFSVGGFLGIGDREVAFPLLGMQIQGNNLMLPTGADGETLGNEVAYDEAQYVPAQSAETLLIEERAPAAGPVTAGATEAGEPPRKTLQTGMDDSGVPLAVDDPGMNDPAEEAEPDFATLDQDDNQDLSREEAGQNSALIERWDQADRDGDGRIDRVELSAFEANLAGSGSNAAAAGAEKDQAE